MLKRKDAKEKYGEEKGARVEKRMWKEDRAGEDGAPSSISSLKRCAVR